MKIQIPQTIEVSANTAVKILYDFFNLPYRNGYYIKKSKSGIKGIYYKEDVSTHGSSDIREFLYSKDEKEVEPFEHLVAIEKLIREKNTEKMGHWIFVHPLQEDDGGGYMCSICNVGDWNLNGKENYCPNCGAKMLQGVKE